MPFSRQVQIFNPTQTQHKQNTNRKLRFGKSTMFANPKIIAPTPTRAQSDLQNLLRLLPKLNPIQDLLSAVMAPLSIHSDPRRFQILLRVLTTLAPQRTETMFTCFPKLPTEVKNRIWQFVAHEPREIKFYSLNAGCYAPNWVKPSPQVVGQYPAPPLINVCRHSRSEGLRYYSMCLERDVEGQKILIAADDAESPPLPRLPNIIWVNFAVDRFVYENRSEFSFYRTTNLAAFNFDAEDVMNIRHVIIPYLQGGWLEKLDRLALLLELGSVKDLSFQVNRRAVESTENDIKGELERFDKWVESMRRTRDYLKGLRVLFEWQLVDNVGLLPPVVT